MSNKSSEVTPGTREQIIRFWRSSMWTHKSRQIRIRDNNTCLVCGVSKADKKRIEVHHITPLKEDYNKRYENNNLITLCCKHHCQAEKGIISREKQQELLKAHIKENKSKAK